MEAKIYNRHYGVDNLLLIRRSILFPAAGILASFSYLCRLINSPSRLNKKATPEVCDAKAAEGRIEAGDIKWNLTITFKTVDITWPDS